MSWLRSVTSPEVRRRRKNWLGHKLRREGENECFTALGWTPEGRRARGRPRTVEKERNKDGWKSWQVAKAVAQDRGIGQTAWRPYAATRDFKIRDATAVRRDRK